jgi:hypothetical protein
MSHWAEIDDNNTVLRVLVGDNNDPAGDEGYQWLIDNLGGTWIKCSYNGTIRKQYPGKGYMYDAIADIFIAPQPFPSWTLNANYDWQAPKPYPTEGVWTWDEENLEWVEFDPQS